MQAACSHTSLSINFAFPLLSDGDSFPNMGLAAFWVISSVCDNVPWIVTASEDWDCEKNHPSSMCGVERGVGAGANHRINHETSSQEWGNTGI